LQIFFFERHNLAAVAMSSKMTLAQFTSLNVAMSSVNAASFPVMLSDVPGTKGLA
jgi:hypothetical protein